MNIIGKSIDFTLVKHYIQYNLCSLTLNERFYISDLIKNEFAKTCVGIILSGYGSSKFLSSFTNSLNSVCIKTILK